LEQNLHRLPTDIDLIVGVPRSGLLCANMLALYLNLPLAEFDSFLKGIIISTGKTRKTKIKNMDRWKPKHALVIDDSILTGKSAYEVRKKIQDINICKTTFAAVYGRFKKHLEVDLVFEKVETPRIFQWNLFHHPDLKTFCLDIDGVLCHDPRPFENDDGKRYISFLKNAKPLMIPSYPVGNLISSRLEKYREPTEQWLFNQNIKYNKLHLLNLNSAKERREKGVHASFKAEIFLREKSPLFVESELNQAFEISKISKKPVLCFSNHQLILPNKPNLYSFGGVISNKTRIINKAYDFKNLIKTKVPFCYYLWSVFKKTNSF
jgi:uncharacterized HAD superfamily protein